MHKVFPLHHQRAWPRGLLHKCGHSLDCHYATTSGRISGRPVSSLLCPLHTTTELYVTFYSVCISGPFLAFFDRAHSSLIDCHQILLSPLTMGFIPLKISKCSWMTSIVRPLFWKIGTVRSCDGPLSRTCSCLLSTRLLRLLTSFQLLVAEIDPHRKILSASYGVYLAQSKRRGTSEDQSRRPFCVSHRHSWREIR